MLDQIINNEAICDLIRCCFESPQISLRQLSVFLEMSQSDNATEHRLTFEDIESWNNESEDDENNVVMVGSATFIDKWCLFGDEKAETKPTPSPKQKIKPKPKQNIKKSQLDIVDET